MSSVTNDVQTSTCTGSTGTPRESTLGASKSAMMSAPPSSSSSSSPSASSSLRSAPPDAEAHWKPAPEAVGAAAATPNAESKQSSSAKGERHGPGLQGKAPAASFSERLLRSSNGAEGHESSGFTDRKSGLSRADMLFSGRRVCVCVCVCLFKCETFSRKGHNVGLGCARASANFFERRLLTRSVVDHTRYLESFY